MSFLEDLKREDNKTLTFNGENAYKSTNSDLLDLSTFIGNSLWSDPEKTVSTMLRAFSEDKLLATKLMFYGRDIRHGGGDKLFGRTGFAYILQNLITVDRIPYFISLVYEYGSYKDIMYLLNDTLDPHKAQAIALELESILQAHDRNQQPTLLAKYMPTETTKNEDMKMAYRTFMKYVDITPKEYRKRNTRLRKLLNLVETNLTEKNYDNIDYSKLPSQASFKYRQAFFTNDEYRYTSFLDSVNKGKTKINTGTLAPYQIIDKILFGNHDNRQALSTLWDNLDRPENNGLNVLPVVDVSGSMYGLPLSVAISLGMILAENNIGDFYNHFITFSEQPKLNRIIDGNVFDKANAIDDSEWGFNTDLEKVFNLVLRTAIKNKTPQEEIPQAIIIFSDMQMDIATGEYDNTFYEKMQRKYAQSGYDLPFIIFWNIGYGDSQPVVENQKNVMQVSGFSPNLFDIIFNLDFDKLEEYTPYKVLLEALNNERYNAIEGLYRVVD